jgi:hypothetical protein
VRARQVARPHRPRPFRGLEVPQDFEGLREFFRRYGYGRLPLGFVFPLSDRVAPYLYDCAVRLLSYYVVPFFIVSREDWSRPLGSAAPHPVADKLISLYSIILDCENSAERYFRRLSLRRWM